MGLEGDPYQPVSLLLGIVRGHWDYQTQLASMDYADDELSAVNMGIAIITPIQEALKIINGDELMKLRRKTDKEMQKQNAPTLDSGFTEPKSSKAAPEITKQGFEDALRRASRKVSDSESEKKGSA